MIVALVLEEFDPRRGGVEQWTFQFARQLLAAGHEVHVVARRFASRSELPVIPHAIETGRSRRAFAEAAATRLGWLRADIVHDMGAGWHCDVFQPHGGSRRASFQQNLLLAPRWLRPLKARVAPLLPRYREFERLLARQYADDGRIFLAISRMVARDLQRWHGVRPADIRLVYNGVDIERFSPAHRAAHRAQVRAAWGVDDDTLLLLIVAHNFALKGVATLIAAVGRLAREGCAVKLAVAGGKRSAVYARLAHRMGAGSRTHFLGSLDDPVPCYAAADAYVQPTFYDPCSLVVLEALASGLPVVTSRFNGAGELITPGQEGFLIDDPANAEELAARLRPLFEPAARKSMARAARKLAEQHTLAENCRQIVAVYNEIWHARARAA